MKVAQVWTVALTSGSLFVLHGCGGGGDDDGGAGTTSTEPTKPTVTTTTTNGGAGTTTTKAAKPTGTTTATATTLGPTTSIVPRVPSDDTPPLSGDEAAAYLNSQYSGYKPGDETSPVGVVMRTANAWGFFCDGFRDNEGCYLGFAKCITSASILNKQVMLHNDDQLFMGLKRHTGIMFNTSVVETKLGRCTYQYDGISWGRYNRGCGGIAPNGEGMCEDKTSAWWNLDPKTGETCTGDSEVVLQDYCPERKDPPTSKTDRPCFWKGPAFNPEGLIESETHRMIEQRVKNQGSFGDRVETWDEVVIDAELLLPELRRDPAVVIPAMVYELSDDSRASAEAKKTAGKMAKAMQAEFQMDEPVPIVGVDTRIHLHAQDVPGPFFFGETWTTQTTTTTPRTQVACCDEDCNGSVKPGWCSQSEANCEQCSGEWCPPPGSMMNGSILI